MIHYANLSGRSNVSAFESHDISIAVRFNDGRTYLYSYASAGKGHVDRMKQLAIAGIGLNSYINEYVYSSYERKW